MTEFYYNTEYKVKPTALCYPCRNSFLPHKVPGLVPALTHEFHYIYRGGLDVFYIHFIL